VRAEHQPRQNFTLGRWSVLRHEFLSKLCHEILSTLEDLEWVSRSAQKWIKDAGLQGW
jgi:hypothetical protein